MSRLVRYTLKSPDDRAHQVAAISDLVAGLTAEGVSGVHYSGFETDDHIAFIGLLEFYGDAGKQAFLDHAAFATYRANNGPTFANPPETTGITAIAATRR